MAFHKRKTFLHHPGRRAQKINFVNSNRFELNKKALECLVESHETNYRRNKADVSEQRDHLVDESRKICFWDEFHSAREQNQEYFRATSGKQQANKSEGCRYGLTNCCGSFPCRTPSSYHTLGYRYDPSNTEWVTDEYIRQNLKSTAMAEHMSMSMDNNLSHHELAMRKERKLKAEMNRRRWNISQKKPIPWVTNYGKPTDYKILSTPVRPHLINNNNCDEK